MPSLRQLNTRIKSVKTITKLTEAMQAVAAMRLRKYTQMLINIQGYTNGLEEFLSDFLVSLNLVTAKRISSIQDFNLKNEGKTLLVIAGTSRGFCGGLHRQVVTDSYLYLKSQGLNSADENQVNFITINKPAQRLISKLGGKVVAFFNGPFKTLNPYDLLPISELIYQEWKTGKVKNVIIASALGELGKTPKIKFQQVLPLSMPESLVRTEPQQVAVTEVNTEEILAEFLPQWLESQVHAAILQTQTAEEGARMLAMNQSTDNAKRLSEKLRLTYFRARQAKITQEISEIVSGSF